MKKLISLLAFGIVLFAACTDDDDPGGSTLYTPSCTGTAKSYATDVAPLVQTYCAGCHPDFTGYTKLIASAGDIRTQIVAGSMPQGTKLTTDQKNAIVCWIDAGAPNN